MDTERVAVDPVSPAPACLERAAAVLRRGDLVALPTETFYGLGAAALDGRAVQRVFAVKGRPEGKPLLVLVDSVAMAEAVAAEIPPAARALMARWWPGPLTIVLRASARVPEALTAGTGTVGVRLSPHPVARGVVAVLGAPVTAPSANPSGQAPPSTADGVLAYFDGLIAMVLDAGPTPGGPPSTVVDATTGRPRVIRPGAARLCA